MTLFGRNWSAVALDATLIQRILIQLNSIMAAASLSCISIISPLMRAIVPFHQERIQRDSKRKQLQGMNILLHRETTNQLYTTCLSHPGLILLIKLRKIFIQSDILTINNQHIQYMGQSLSGSLIWVSVSSGLGFMLSLWFPIWTKIVKQIHITSIAANARVAPMN